MPSFALNNLASRIVVFFSLLLAAVLAVVFILVTTASYQIARQQNSEELALGERVFRQLLTQNRNQLTQAARILTADFAFRDAVTSNDLDTVLSALDNFGRRIDADIMMLVSLDGKFVADTLHPERVGQTAPIGELIREAELRGSAASVMRIGNETYQIVVVPVLAPDPAGWVTLGFVIDDALAQDLRELTSLQVSFLSRGEDDRWSLFASTQPAAEQSALLDGFNKAKSLDRGNPEGLLTSGFASLVSPLGEDDTVVAVLQRSIEQAVARFDPLRATLLALAIVSLMLAIAGSVIIARRITRPINALARIARHIQEGDYSQGADEGDSGEIGALAASFNHMRKAIASRESEIRRLAFEDTLTGLPNRAMFNAQLGQLAKLAQRTGEPFSVLIIDLDRFKIINDTLGHEAGDQVLQLVAGRLRAAIRDSDIVARFGGDEYVVLLPATNRERIGVIVTRIQLALDQPIVVENQPVDIGGSIGISSYPKDGKDPSVLMRRADIAMYSAKRSHSGFATYDASLDEHRQEHLHLLGELRKAIDENELLLYFQPKVDLMTGRTVGVEALVRWQHPARGIIPPSDFIPFAEHTGAIRMVTRWVMREAIQQCGEWLERGLALRMSLNISARDLVDSELPENLDTLLRESKVPPGMVCLEITESALMEDPASAQATVRRLHGLGVELAIDDYGIGHSSLAYVKDLPVNELKIDRTFVMNMAEKTGDIAIVRSAIELGHNLGLRVVAEGVESEKQLQLLRELRCDVAQGYVISKPLPERDFALWLQTGRWSAQRRTPRAGEVTAHV